MTNYEWLGQIDEYWDKEGHNDLDIWNEISFINWHKNGRLAYRDEFRRKNGKQ